jgi:hypothetical protein
MVPLIIAGIVYTYIKFAIPTERVLEPSVLIMR